MTDTSREAYGAWAKADGLDVDTWSKNPGSFKYKSANDSWVAWQASRAALEAEQAQVAESAGYWLERAKELVEIFEDAPSFSEVATEINVKQPSSTERAVEPIQRRKTIAKSKWVNDLRMKAVFENYDEREAQQVEVPAATVTGIFLDKNNQTRMCIDTELPLMTELFTHPARISKREPMTDAEINGLFLSIKKELFSIPGGSANVPWHRRVIVRAVEAHYGVTPRGDAP